MKKKKNKYKYKYHKADGDFDYAKLELDKTLTKNEKLEGEVCCLEIFVKQLKSKLKEAESSIEDWKLKYEMVNSQPKTCKSSYLLETALPPVNQLAESNVEEKTIVAKAEMKVTEEEKTILRDEIGVEEELVVSRFITEFSFKNLKLSPSGILKKARIHLENAKKMFILPKTKERDANIAKLTKKADQLFELYEAQKREKEGLGKSKDEIMKEADILILKAKCLMDMPIEKRGDRGNELVDKWILEAKLLLSSISKKPNPSEQKKRQKKEENEEKIRKKEIWIKKKMKEAQTKLDEANLMMKKLSHSERRNRNVDILTKEARELINAVKIAKNELKELKSKNTRKKENVDAQDDIIDNNQESQERNEATRTPTFQIREGNVSGVAKIGSIFVDNVLRYPILPLEN